MKNRSTLFRRLALLAVGLGTACGIAWLWFASSGRNEARALDGLDERPPARVATELERAPPEPSRPARVQATQGEPVHWIDGRVVLPRDVRGNTVEVLALPLAPRVPRWAPGRNRPSSDEVAELELHAPTEILARAVVDVAAGTDDAVFRIGFAEDAPDAVRLALRDRYLYLDAAPVVRPRQTEPVTLEARLGARLIVHGTVLGDELPAALEGGSVLVQGFQKTDAGEWVQSGASMREVELDATGTLVCDALAADREYTVSAHPARFGAELLRGIALTPGETTERTLEFSAGTRIAGRVVDEHGEPVAGAEIQAMVLSEDNRSRTRKMTKTEADGRFVLGGLQAGTLDLTASHPGFLLARLSRTLEEQASLDELDLLLRTGEALAGRVEWPNGDPAAGAFVRTVDHDAKRNCEAQTAADGTFVIAGLENGPYDVRAEAQRTRDSLTLAWVARIDAVPGGAAALRLVLQAPPGLAGRVVDELDQPIERFTLTAQLARSTERLLAGSSGAVRKSFQSADGTFFLADTGPGLWNVSGESDEHVRLDDAPGVLVGSEHGEPTSPVTVVLHRAATVAGVVLGPSREPVPGAQVSLGFRDPDLLEGLDDTHTAEADERGRFRLVQLPPGTATLLAARPDLASSEPQQIDLHPGRANEGVELRLRIGGTLTGEVLKDGLPSAGREVALLSTELGMGPKSKTDDAGRFRIEHVAPGSYNLMVENGNRDMPSFSTVAIVDGETTHVVVGAPEREIRVHGRITRGGAPFHRSDLIVLGEGGSLFESLAKCDVEDDGRYTVALKRPGAYTFYFERIRLEHRVQIPDADDVELDIALPAGTIAGIVRNADGPVSGAKVNLYHEHGASVLAYIDGGQHATTHKDGRFVFDGLTPGVYALATEGNGDGRQVRGGIALGPDAHVDGIDFMLVESTGFEGVVKSTDGRPIPSAAVFFRDAAGLPLHAFSEHETDRAGRFEDDDLPPGRITILVRTGDGRAAEVSTLLKMGDENRIEIVVRPASLLRVAMRTGAGEPTAAVLEVRDERGREHANLMSRWDLARLMEDGYSQTERCVGPLPAGTYRVHATDAEGRSASREIRLEGTGEQALELVLR